MSGKPTYEAVSGEVLSWAEETFPAETAETALQHLLDKADEASNELYRGLHGTLPDDFRRKVVSCGLIWIHLAALAGIEDVPTAMAVKLAEDKASEFRFDPVYGYARRVRS